MDKTYVFAGDEVILTGRTAVKTLKSSREKIIYEIELKNKPQYTNEKNKWVELVELFQVQS